MDSRKKVERRTETFTLKLTTAEQESLIRLAEDQFRSPADQLRFLLAEAVKASKAADQADGSS